MRMSHFICTGGCKGVSDHAGTCKAIDCDHFEQPLVPCECPDGQHGGAFDRLEKMGEEEEEDKV